MIYRKIDIAKAEEFLKETKTEISGEFIENRKGTNQIVFQSIFGRNGKKQRFMFYFDNVEESKGFTKWDALKSIWSMFSMRKEKRFTCGDWFTMEELKRFDSIFYYEEGE